MGKVSFHFRLPDFMHSVEKAEGGRKRKYLKGITSGIKQDGHTEKMTEKCIKSFHAQAQSGDILLYADRHDVSYTDDIGILVNHTVLPNSDWETEYRLYDEDDGVGANTIEKADKLWKQINGLPPYSKPRQKGFSIEGTVDDKDIIQHNTQGGERVMDNVLLDGVVVVPRPAYQDSIATAVYKALGEMSPWKISKEVEKVFKSGVIKSTDNYHLGRYKLEDNLYEAIESVMKSDMVNKDRILDEIFEVHKSHMKSLITKSDFSSDHLFIDKGQYRDQLFHQLGMVAKSLSHSLGIELVSNTNGKSGVTKNGVK